jgi:hypothetical protein
VLFCRPSVFEGTVRRRERRQDEQRDRLSDVLGSVRNKDSMVRALNVANAVGGDKSKIKTFVGSCSDYEETPLS